MTDSDEIGKYQKASLIDDEIKKGELDEESIKFQIKNNNSSRHNNKHILDNNKMMNSRRDEICREKLYTRKVTKIPKTIRIPVYKTMELLSKRNYIPRQCMTKEEWMTYISTPNRKYSRHFKGLEEKALRAIPLRIDELAQPPRQRMVATLNDRGAILPMPLIDRLITVLEVESSLTPEQVEESFRTKRNDKKRKKKKQWLQKQSKTSIRVETGRTLDEDTIVCQYVMAEAFLKSILQWESTIPKDQFQDITKVIFNRLRQLFHCTSVDKDARKVQQMQLLADIISAWIAGVLFEVAELKEDELEKDYKIQGDSSGHDDENDGMDGDDSDSNRHGADSDENGNDDQHEINKRNNGNKIDETQNEGIYYGQTNKEKMLKMLAENTAEPGSEITPNIHSGVINEIVVDDFVRSKISPVIDANSWYRWQKKVGSESFIRRQFNTNSINEKRDIIVLVESNLSKNSVKNPSYSIVEREINPNF